MGLAQLNFEGKNKVEVSIMRLREFEPLTKGEGFYFADSYGKDSCAVERLLDMADVKHDAHYSKGGIDPPELVLFGREYHPDTFIERPEMSVWKGVMIHGMPRRQSRWCCELIKEKHGSGRIVVTGIRWAESSRRRQRPMLEAVKYHPKRKSGTFLHPIIDWPDSQVWAYIHSRNVTYCNLYDEGWKRLGCVGCPMVRDTKAGLRWPKTLDIWRRGIFAWYRRKQPERWSSPQALWEAWLDRDRSLMGDIREDECTLFDSFGSE